jgi:transposase InsO family protein
VHEVSRQAYYQYLNRQSRLCFQEEILRQLVGSIRRRQPKIGGRKLYHLLKPQLEKLDYNLGRDRFFDFLRANDLLIKRKKKYTRTTDSNHGFGWYTNLLTDRDITDINQVFVADITYLDTLEGFVYLALITELFSRKIVGWDVSDSLAVEGSLRALNMAFSQAVFSEGSIHHSDRGIQYSCYAYTDLLKSKGIEISMAAKGNPYENPVAERVNGILKLEFLLDQIFNTKRDAKAATGESIFIYNHERPHGSLGNKMPAQVYQERLALCG